MEIYLIRHTNPQTDKGVCYGQSDIPLSPTFTIEAQKLLKHLPHSFDIVYSSPMSRCYTLSQLISPQQEVIQDLRLHEMNFGDWEMKKWSEINKTDLDKWMSDFVNVAAPNGESFIELNFRVNEFINELKKQSYQKAAVITHAGVIRCFIAKVLEMPLKNAFKIPCDFSSCTKIFLDKENCLTNIEYINRL